MYFAKKSEYNDIREKSFLQWLDEMEKHDDVAVRCGVKLAREYMQYLKDENEKLREENRKQMTRIRLASNGADENGQVLLEVLNTLCWQLRADEYRSTEQMLHPTVEEAKKTVKDRIARFKQAKDFKQK